MIEGIRLEDFIAHKHTDLKFDNGLTLFIGHNGSGKSSVIDAFTFALYGQHTRRSNRNLLRRGASSSMVVIELSVRGRKFKVLRTLGPSGQLESAKLIELMAKGEIVKVSGERRQFAESVAEEIGKVLGLDYSKLKVAAVVQQGELSAIIESQPREFKELINSLFGLDKLDQAYLSMKELIQNFRVELRNKIGYDDSDLVLVKRKLDETKELLAEEEDVLRKLQRTKDDVRLRVSYLEDVIAQQEPLHDKVTALERTAKNLVSYVQNRKKELEGEISKQRQLIATSKQCMSTLDKKTEVSTDLENIRIAISEIEDALQNVNNDVGRLKALVEVGSKLQIVDGKCPVCNSPVSKIDEMYDVTHLRSELEQKTADRKELLSKKDLLKSNERTLRKKEMEISNAISFLEANDIKSADDLSRMELQVTEQETVLKKISTILNDRDAIEQIVIDNYSKELSRIIMDLKKETAGFDISEYNENRIEHKRLLSTDLPTVEKDIGACKAKLEQAKNECSTLEYAVAELERAVRYIKILERIRASVYNRDGVVGLSLRTWALKTISQKASDYATMFNMNLSRLQMSEKAREIVIQCYGRSGAVDIHSLSGGEKVAVALAIRLAIAYVMGASKLDFVILDEPTIHLDEERRKSLVQIITEAFKSGMGPLAQMILITHDSEIFENAEVDNVYRFSITHDGTHVTKI